MRFTIKNINAVASADINLNGLTVIAGENGSGKSTVGKILFSTVKSAATVAHGDGESRRRNIERLADELYGHIYALRLSAPDEVAETLPLSRSSFISAIRSMADPDETKAFFGRLSEVIDKASPSPRIRSLINIAISDISKEISTKDSRNEDLGAEMQRLVASEFQNRVQSFGSEESEINFILDDEKSGARFKVRGEAITEPHITGSGFPTDATYVESPLYIHLMDVLSRIPGRENELQIPTKAATIPIHVTDIMEKVESMRYFYDSLSAGSARPSTKIRDLIGGEFYYDSVRRSIMFKSGDNEYYPINVASGAKSFGIIQMLLDGRYISPAKLLIWDEPENHLHPRWQIRLADMLVQLAKEGVPILVSTHSPYFIQGIRYFARKHESESYIDYYLSEMAGGAATVSCVTDDLNRIFFKLAAPLNEIMDLSAQ